MRKLTNYLIEKHSGKRLCFSLLLLLWLIGFDTSAQTTATFNASGNFITPAGVTTATVEAWGGGGAGGGSTSNSDGGGGGGGGAYSKVVGTAVSGTMPVTVGIGGVGDTGAGNNGGDSSFNSVVLAKGGTGGSVTGGTGGSGGTGGVSSAGTGTTKFSGGTGGRGRDNNSGSGGPGGSSAGTAANGNSGASTWSSTTAIAAPTGGGAGGAGGGPGSAGSAGTAPGGGGGGAGDGTNNGGSGAAGRVVLTYTCPTYALTAATTATGPFCGASASVVTLTSSSMPNGSYTVTYNLSGGTTATGSTAAMTFASGTGTFTTSVLNSSATPTTITITGISSGTVGNGACASTISTFNTVSVTAFAVSANAGTAFTKTCSSNASGAVIGEASAAGYTYSWSPTTGLSSSTVSNPTANPTTTTTYTVTKTYTATGCSATANVTVTVNNTPPTVVAGADYLRTCTSNNSKVIGETTVSGNTYSWSPTAGLSSATVSNPTATPTTTTTYTVTKTTTATGCSAQASITVTVDTAAPGVNAGADFTKTCVANVSGAQIGEAAVAGFTYSWSPTTGLSSGAVSNPTANPTTTTTYTVTKTSTTNGCVGTDTVTVTVNNTAVVAAAGADFTKTCATNPSGKQIGETSAAGFTYSWSPATGLSSSTVSNPTANPTVSTTYTVTKTNTSSGCSATDNIVVTVDLTTPTADAGADFTKTCALNPNGKAIGETAQSGHTYSWSPTTGLSSSTASNPTANPTTTTTYTVTKRNSTTGCTDTDTVTVTVDTTAPTVAALTGNQNVCAGATTTFSSTTGGGVWGTSNSAVATVSGGVVNGVSAGTTNINYTVTGANGCTTTVSRAVTVNPLPASIVATGATAICPGASTILTGSANIPYDATLVTLDDFNGTPTYAVSGSNSGGGTAFSQRSSGYGVGLGSITNSVDGSKFMIAVASSFGSATTNSSITSPVLNTTGYTGLSFSYSHSFGKSGTTTAIVEVATNAAGTNWVTVKNYTASQGSLSSFVADNINLDAYINQPTLRVRFTTAMSVNFGTAHWAIENAKFTGTTPVNAQYSWTADTASGVNGLPGTAGTTSETNASISVNPSVATAYTLIATDPLTGCTQNASPVAVTIKPTPTANTVADAAYCSGVTTSDIALSGSPSGVTYDISGGSAIGLADVSNVTSVPSFTAVAGSATISITPKANGCTGSPVTSTITVTQSTANGSVTTSVCDTYTWPANAQTYTDSGIYTHVVGCNTAILDLTVTPSTTNGNMTASACDTYTWAESGQTYTTTGIYTHVNDCNTATLDLTITPSTTAGSLTTSACDSYNWAENGTTYTSSGVYTHVVGCNTATLNLTITPSTTNGNLTTSACDSYTWTANNQTYTSSGIFTHVVGCNTATLDLTVTPSTTNGSATVSACVSYMWPENGQTYTASGIYMHNVGCNTAILTLTVNTSPQTFYADADGDGYGSGAAILSCNGQPANTSVNNTDCAPGDASKWRTSNLFIDADGDSYNNGFPAQPVCYGGTVPAGYIAVNFGTDCDDTLATVNSNASEVLGNGIDDNCDGVIDEVTPTSHLIDANCNVTLQSLSHTLFAYQLNNYRNELGPVQAYRFRVTNGATVRVYTTNDSRFSLADLPGGANYATTYTVEVSAKTGGYFRAYGSPCTVSTPAIPNGTYITDPINGSVLNDISNTIFCRMVPSASGYRFRVRNGATVIGTFDSHANRFSLVNLGISNISFGTTYTIDVLLKFGSQFRPDTEYGPAALVTTPATPATSRIIEPSCGSTINSFWATIFAQQVLGAQGYKFVVTNGAQTREFTTPNPRFSLRNLPGGGAANTTYTIRVDVLYNSSYVVGVSTCTITTLPTASRQTEQALDIFEVSAYPNPYAQAFNLNINTSSEQLLSVKVYDMLGREVESRSGNTDLMTASEIGANYPSGVYNVIVAQGEQVKTLRVVKR